VFVKVPDDMLDVGSGRHQDLAGQGGVAVQKSDVVLVLEEDLLKVVAGSARRDGADETRTTSDTPDVAGEIERFFPPVRIAFASRGGNALIGGDACSWPPMVRP